MNKFIITVAGKGGVGKTSLSAAIVRELVKDFPGAKILAIDADPAVGLSTALGVKVKLTMDEIRKRITEGTSDSRDKQQIQALLAEAKYQLFDAIVEEDGFSFLAVGRPETAGCYCGINSYLKQVISMMSEEFDFVVIDGEAGIEQVNRRVMEKVTHMILVTDPCKKGTQVVQTIKQVADELVMYKEIGVVVNRLASDEQKQYIDVGGIPILTYIKEDQNLQLADVKGESVFDLPDDSNICVGAVEALKALKIIN